MKLTVVSIYIFSALQRLRQFHRPMIGLQETFSCVSILLFFPNEEVTTEFYALLPA